MRSYHVCVQVVEQIGRLEPVNGSGSEHDSRVDIDGVQSLSVLGNIGDGGLHYRQPCIGSGVQASGKQTYLDRSLIDHVQFHNNYLPLSLSCKVFEILRVVRIPGGSKDCS